MRKITFISLVLLYLILTSEVVYGLQEVDPEELTFKTEEMMDLFEDKSGKFLATHEVWIYTEADCTTIRWTLEGQTHSDPLLCGRAIGFVNVPHGTYHTVVEGCGGRMSGYLDVYKDMHLLVCPSDLSMTDCCPEGIYSDDSYLCDECSGRGPNASGVFVPIE